MAATAEAGVCNLALTAIGNTAFVDDLDEDSTEAKVAKEIFAFSRDVVLERFEWRFAARRATLALDAGAVSGLARNGWLYVYALPADCIAPRRITVDGIRNPNAENRIPFAIEASASVAGGPVDARVLLTDQAEAELQYTSRVETVALWSPLFVDALKWNLAAQFALGIQKKPAVAQAMTAQFERAIGQAFAAQLNQGREDRPPDSEFISVR